MADGNLGVETPAYVKENCYASSLSRSSSFPWPSPRAAYRLPHVVLCKKPYRQAGQTYPCGQCLPCRFNRRRLWTHRILLEQRLHEFTSFATLTYSPEHYPSDGSLTPRHCSLWLKRLRERLGPARPIRYFLVGEYGDQTQRAHYHAALYGVASIETPLLESTWGMGMVHAGELTPDSAQYIAGYVTKKMTAADDVRLQGRHPEFARMSRNPGLGAGAVGSLADALNDRFGAQLLAASRDVPTSLNHGRKSLPLGRYIRGKLREEMGFSDTTGKAGQEHRRIEEVQAMRSSPLGVKGYIEKEETTNRVKIRQLENKAKIFSKKGSI